MDGLQEKYMSKLSSHSGNFNLLIIYVDFLTLERPQKITYNTYGLMNLMKNMTNFKWSAQVVKTILW